MDEVQGNCSLVYWSSKQSSLHFSSSLLPSCFQLVPSSDPPLLTTSSIIFGLRRPQLLSCATHLGHAQRDLSRRCLEHCPHPQRETIPRQHLVQNHSFIYTQASPLLERKYLLTATTFFLPPLLNLADRISFQRPLTCPDQATPAVLRREIPRPETLVRGGKWGGEQMTGKLMIDQILQ